MMLALSLLALGAPVPPAENHVPKWKVTYNMSESTSVMPCNYTGL